MIKNEQRSHDDYLGWFSKPQPGHAVQFYSSETVLLTPLTSFISSGLNSGDGCIVIATRAHIEALDKQLEETGVSVLESRQQGRYVVLDAQQTLAEFMIDGLPDKQRFLDSVGSLVEKHARKNKLIRAYGEMVALLWKEGNKDAVIQLENLWNELSAVHGLSLYCAYPDLHFSMDTEARDDIRDCHSVFA
jgi:MEDS: MEthanogen/methylotroph, DcmR Sensory domain